MGVLDVSLPQVAAVFTSKDMSVVIGGKTFPQAINSVAHGTGLEGVEHQYALGSQKPFATSDGVEKPDDVVLKVHQHALPGILAIVAGGGTQYLGVPFDMELLLDKASSPGSALLTAAAKLPTQSIGILTAKIIHVASTTEANGAAITVDVTCKPLDYRFAGMAGTVASIVGSL